MSMGRITTLLAGLALAVSGIATAQGAAKAPHDGYHVVLLLATGETPASHQKPLPAGVEKALRDAAEFLPFTYYEVEDQAVLRGTGRNLTTRLQTRKNRDYSLAVDTRPSGSSADRVSVSVVLTDKTWPLAEKSTGREVMATEYSARVGETVLVGTSKVRGQVSLVLLITLLPQATPHEAAPEDAQRVPNGDCEVTGAGKSEARPTL